MPLQCLFFPCGRNNVVPQSAVTVERRQSVLEPPSLTQRWEPFTALSGRGGNLP